MSDDTTTTTETAETPTMFARVRAFMIAMQQNVPEKFDTAALASYPDELRANLILEEAAEYATAAGFGVAMRYEGGEPGRPVVHRQRPSAPLQRSVPEMVDALLDTIYVSLGALAALGLSDAQVEALFAEVQRSNMAKLNPDGKPNRREDGKVLKPAGWSPPNIDGLLERFWFERPLPTATDETTANDLAKEIL